MVALVGCGASGDASGPTHAPSAETCPRLLWTRAFDAHSGAVAIAAAPDGDLVYAGPADDGTLGTTSGGAWVPASGGITVVRYHPDGTVRWARQDIDASEAVAVVDVAVGPDGAVVVTGTFRGTMASDGEAADLAATVDGTRTWVARWSADGVLEWVVGGYSDAGVSPVGIAASDSAILVAGTYAVSDGPMVWSNGLTSPAIGGDDDVFLAALGLDGTALWVRVVGGAASDELDDLAVGQGVATLALRAGSDLFTAQSADGEVSQPGHADDTTVLVSYTLDTGELRPSVTLGEPASPWAPAITATPDGELLAAIRAGSEVTYGEGDEALRWETAEVHTLVTALSGPDLAWSRHALVDIVGFPSAEAIDAGDTWVALSTTFSGDVWFYGPSDVYVTYEGALADAMVVLLDDALAVRCAYPMDGPGVDAVYAAVDAAGGFGIVGTTEDLILARGTPEETRNFNPGRAAFVARFAPR